MDDGAVRERCSAAAGLTEKMEIVDGHWSGETR